MTSRAIMSNDINNIVANNTKVSKKSESLGSTNDSFSKVMEKNNYENQDVSVEKHGKSDFHSSRPEVISKKNINYVNNNQETQHKTSFTKEQFVTDLETTINDIANAYKETLDLSDEELMEIMENLAINVFQLPMQDLAKNIVLEANGENDITALLVNENALEDLQSMNQFFDKYNAETKLNIPVEELENLVKEAISNLVASKKEVLANGNITDNQTIILDDGLLDSTQNTDLSVENSVNLDNTKSSEKITLSETVVLDNGKEINIEVVDVRDNMTKFAKLEEQITSEYEKSLVLKEDISNKNNNFIETTDVKSREFITAEDNLKGNMEQLSKDVVNKDNLGKESQNNKIIGNDNEENMFAVKNILDKNLVEKDMSKKNLQSIEVQNSDIQTLDTDNIDMSNISLDDGTDMDETLKTLDTDGREMDTETLNEKLMDNTVDTKMDAESDSFNNNSDNDFTNDTANETFYDKFITNLEKSFGIDEGSLLNEVSHIKEMQEIVNQVVDKIKVHISKEMTTMKLNLNPEHLGKVELEVTSKSGILTADFVVENETAKEALEKGLPTLIEKFHEQGLKVEAIEVSIADYDFTRQDGERNKARNQGNDDKKKKRSGKISLDEVSNQQEVVKEEHKIMSNHGIDYTA